MKKLILLLTLTLGLYQAQAQIACSVTVNATSSGSTITTAATASGGAAPYTYSYTLNPGSVTNGTGIFAGLTTGSYNVCVTAFDSLQNMCSIGCDSVFVSNNTFCNTSISSSASGTTITSTATASFGTAPYTYSYTLNPGNITNTTGVFTGLTNGGYFICATATDANNQVCTPDCDSAWIGTQGPCNTTVTATSSGSTVTAVGTATGGTAPYIYSYNLNPGNITNATGVFTGLTTGSYTVCVTAIDAMQNTCSIACDSVFVSNNTFCSTNLQTSVSGNTITATATALGGTAPFTYSYNLMPGNITNTTGIFSGLANGTYIVCATATDANNQQCTQNCNTLIIGMSAPCNTTITASSSGTTITASATASGGAAPYTYSYNLMPGNITNTTGVFSGLAVGVYSVCATATDANNQTCSVACDTTLFISGSFFCTTTINTTASGSTVTSVGAATGGTAPYTYSYNLNPGNITNSTGIFPGLANGLYSVCVTATDAMQTTCSIACDSAFVNSSTGCITTISSTVSGNTVTAVGSASGGTAPYTYSYTLNPGSITNATGVFPGLANGWYGICVTAFDAMQNVCSIDCDSAFISNTIGGCFVTAAFSESISGLTVNFTNNSTITNGTITNYGWTFGDGNVSSTASPSHTYATAGPYNVVLVVTGYDSLQNQCIDSTSKTITVSMGTAVGNVHTQKLSIYPNPTSKNFIIELPENETLENLVLTDVSGRKLATEYKVLGNRKLAVSLKNEAFGIYFIKLLTDKNIYTSSIMKQE